MQPPFLLTLPLLLLAGCPLDGKPDDTAETGTPAVDGDGDGHDASADCDDDDASVHPGAEETCNGRDDDCDGEADEGVTGTYWADADGDGWGDPGTAFTACTQPSGYTVNAEDCDDGDAAVHPTAQETCNDRDDDCDGSVDDGVTTPWYLDRDGDGWGDPEHAIQACARPDGFTDNGLDCDDDQAAVHPGAEEDCDDLDNDCDGAVDEEVTTTFYQDWDGDGWGDSEHPVRACELPSGCATNDQDCDDGTAAVHPDAEEICDGLDDDCDGDVDGGASDAPTWYADLDGDGFGDDGTALVACAAPTGWIATPGDCDDRAAGVHPVAAETCDGVDDDCDGAVDEDDAIDAPTWYRDLDGDGWGDDSVPRTACLEPSGYVLAGGDCDDAGPTVSPSALEHCDGVDDDCDGAVDEDEATDAPTWFSDADGDGWGLTTGATVACSAPSGAVADPGDCDDADPAVNPAALELCDGIDDDCDGVVDEGDAADADPWFADSDADGYADPTSWITACTQPAGYLPFPSAVTDADCDDTDPAVYPGSGAPELPGDGIDSNCDGYDGCTDLNCDGWPDLVLPGQRTGTSGSYAASTLVYYFTGFGFSSSYRTALSTSGATAGIPVDLDQDGFLELLSLEQYDGSTYELDSAVYWGSETGLDPSDRLDLPTLGAADAAVADLDGDGWLDLVVANHTSDTSYAAGSYLYWGGPAGFSTADRDTLPTNGPLDVEIADLDGDGWPEIVFANYCASSGDYTTDSYVYWGSAAGYSDGDRTALPTNGARQVLIEDTNGDGWDDLVFTCNRGDSSTSTVSFVYYGSAAGYSTTNRDALPTVGARRAAAGDLDGDGYIDLVFANYDGGFSCHVGSYVYWGASGGFSRASRTTLSAGSATDVAIADLDHDGWGDLVLAAQGCGGYATDSYVYWNSGSGGFSSADRTALATLGAARVAVADIDLDGWEDLVFANQYSGGTFDVDSYVYYSTAGAFSAALRDDLPAYGPAGPPGIAGAE